MLKQRTSTLSLQMIDVTLDHEKYLQRYLKAFLDL